MYTFYYPILYCTTTNFKTKHSSTAHAVIMRDILYKILHTYDTLHYLTIQVSEGNREDIREAVEAVEAVHRAVPRYITDWLWNV